MTRAEALRRLIVLSGGVDNVAHLLGVPAQTVYSWKRQGKISKRGFFLACMSSLIPFDLVRPLANYEIATVSDMSPAVRDAMVLQDEFETRIADGAAHTIPFLAQKKAM